MKETIQVDNKVAVRASRSLTCSVRRGKHALLSDAEWTLIQVSLRYFFYAVRSSPQHRVIHFSAAGLPR
ncbi:MAG: hypothetical protein ABIP06_05945 [Pyrinomonadaceae bacterium]